MSGAGEVPRPATGVGSGGWNVGGREHQLARIVFALMVLGSFAAFAVTQRLKHTPTIVQDIKMSTSFTPGSRTRNAVERISFEIAHADRVRVTVIDSQDNTVRTLARDLQVPAYKQIHFYWNGHEAHGRRAPAGTYRVRIELFHQKREVLSPSAFELLGQ